MNVSEKYRHYLLFCLLFVLLFLKACIPSSDNQQVNKTIDERLRSLLRQAKVTQLDPGPALSDTDPKVILGQFLMHDKILSANKDIACSTCHHASLATTDNRPLPIGTGGTDLGMLRTLGENRPFVPRHSPELFNRNSPEWTTIFWDSRISGKIGTSIKSPAGKALPNGLDNLLAVQAMFPVTSRDEMRGTKEDYNELAHIEDDDFSTIWTVLFKRLMEIEAYRQLFQQAYPETNLEDMTFVHAANAIAAFEAHAFTFINSPFDNYLAGDNQALSIEEKKGALLFYGEAGCATCHSGSLLTDQQHHNVGIPQLGPGKGKSAPLDHGRFLITGVVEDKFGFRTPPLRNVSLTSPYMHSGVYQTLEEVVMHFNDVETTLKNFDYEHLPANLQEMSHSEPDVINELLDHLDKEVLNPLELDTEEQKQLVSFLHSLTDPAASDLEYLIPESVPSGLAVND